MDVILSNELCKFLGKKPIIGNTIHNDDVKILTLIFNKDNKDNIDNIDDINAEKLEKVTLFFTHLFKINIISEIEKTENNDHIMYQIIIKK